MDELTEDEIKFLDYIKIDELLGRYYQFNRDRQYDSSNHRDTVYDSGRKDWK